MKGPSLLSRMTGGLFGGAFRGREPPKKEESTVEPMNVEKKRGTKRSRHDESDTPAVATKYHLSRTPTLIIDGERARTVKRLRVTLPSSLAASYRQRKADPQADCDLLMKVPQEVVGHVLGFLNTTDDRFSLQSTCREFRRISDNDDMLVNIKLAGHFQTGEKGILTDNDSPSTAAAKLRPFARAKNLEATYMLGMIKSYCYDDIDKGIFLLKLASSLGYVRSSYALGLILRDTCLEESNHYFNDAASRGYLPALQEILPAREMKARFGEPDATELRRHLDPVGLNRLLGRFYLQSSHLRDVNTSHCWNPLCGRWAFKATSVVRGQTVLFPLRSVAATRPHPHHRPASRRAGYALRQDHSSPALEVAQSYGEARVSRMKMCSRCCRAKYCSKLCQVYDWRSGRHKMECQFL